MERSFSPNFLDESTYLLPVGTTKKHGIFLIWTFLILICVSLIFAPGISLLLTGIFFVCVCTIRLDIGVYAIAAAALFHEWHLTLSDYAVLNKIPFLSSLNAPLVDFIAVLVCCGFLLSVLLDITPFSLQRFRFIKVGMLWYALFIVAGLVSAKMGIGGIDFTESLSALLRPALFVFVAFVLLPVIIIHDKSILKNALIVVYGVGVLVTIYGISSLFIIDPGMYGWYRAAPFSLWGFTPLGLNHNLLAEVLVITAPIGMWLVFVDKKDDAVARFWYSLSTVCMIAVVLLTLSRAGWLALMVEAGVCVVIYRTQVIHFIKYIRGDVQLIALALLLFTVGYMGIFLGSQVVDSSNAARIEMSTIAFDYIHINPWFGYGPGSYLPLLEDIAVFRMQFGEPIDAHGFIQKIGFEYGLVGLTFFMLFLAWVLRRLWQIKTRDPMYSAILMAVAGIICFELFNTSYLNSVLWFPVGLGVVAIVLVSEKRFIL